MDAEKETEEESRWRPSAPLSFLKKTPGHFPPPHTHTHTHTHTTAPPPPPPLARPKPPAAAPAAATTSAPAVPLTQTTFHCTFHVEWGQCLRLVGSAPALGAWSLAGGLDLAWSEGDEWTGSVPLPAGALVEYKYVLVGADGRALAWQRGNNAVLAVSAGGGGDAGHEARAAAAAAAGGGGAPQAGGRGGGGAPGRGAPDALEVYDAWDGGGAGVLAPGAAAAASREGALAAWAAEAKAGLSAARGELRTARVALAAASAAAAEARAEAAALARALAASEAARAGAVASAAGLAAANASLAGQLRARGAAFRAALEGAAGLMAEEGGGAPRPPTAGQRRGA